MLRKTAVTLGTIACLILVAGPAGAKGISEARFSGPGLPPGGITITHGSYENLMQTGLLDLKSPTLSIYDMTRRDLGPAYQARYRMDYAPRHQLRQVVYPYANGGPVTFTPPGQHLGQDYESFQGGWYLAPTALLPFLVKNGFPEEAPGTKPERKVEVATAGLATGAESGSSDGWIWVVVGAVVVGLAATVLVARMAVRRRPD